MPLRRNPRSTLLPRSFRKSSRERIRRRRARSKTSIPLIVSFFVLFKQNNTSIITTTIKKESAYTIWVHISILNDDILAFQFQFHHKNKDDEHISVFDGKMYIYKE